MYKKELETLLPRCFEMYDFMAEHINQLQHYELVPDLKFRMAFQSGILSFEHGLATLKLIADGFVSSGLALMRPQYESLVRGFWLMHADTDNWIAKLRTAGQVGPNELSKLETPMISDMLKLLDKSDAPNHILKQLQDFKAITNSTLNSFTHCGLIALFNNGMGYDQKLIYDALRNCNAVAAINLQMLSILTGDDEAITPVSNMHHQFHDCLPIVHA